MKDPSKDWDRLFHEVVAAADKAMVVANITKVEDLRKELEVYEYNQPFLDPNSPAHATTLKIPTIVKPQAEDVRKALERLWNAMLALNRLHKADPWWVADYLEEKVGQTHDEIRESLDYLEKSRPKRSRLHRLLWPF
jgi:2,4-dienoyl-CoA reductase-like NADH-dependent reductase (Old Yellow Enzyme family)